MSERLTKRDENGNAYYDWGCLNRNHWALGRHVDRLAAYEDSGLSPEQVHELAQAKADGRLVVLKASISQDVWFYDGANRLMQGKVIEYLDCGNGLIYQVQGAKKGLWLHEHEIFLSQEEAEKVLEVRE